MPASVSSKYISARTWAKRWDCSVSSIRRAAGRLPVRRVYVGSGRNGLVRYSLDDIEKVEREHGFAPAARANRRTMTAASQE